MSPKPTCAEPGLRVGLLDGSRQPRYVRVRVVIHRIAALAGYIKAKQSVVQAICAAEGEAPGFTRISASSSPTALTSKYAQAQNQKSDMVPPKEETMPLHG